MKKLSLITLSLILWLVSCSKSQAIEKDSQFTVFQMNLWCGGTKVPGGFWGIVGVLEEIDADVVFLCETQEGLIPRVVSALEERGIKYYESSLSVKGVILSKIKPSRVCIIERDEGRAMLKANITIEGCPIAFYSGHTDYRNYACYMPRGYSGTTWKKIDAPIIDEDIVLKSNRLSYRDESIRAFVEDAEKEIVKGCCVIMGGDLNEPSHLDWQADTKYLFDHNGAIINWDCSVMLYEAGFKDSFREIYPNPVKNPGFTFPAGNKLAEDAKLEKLAWAPEADERDRIDFIYYRANNNSLTLKTCTLVGPGETVLRNEIVPNDSEDTFITPKSVWPSDHKGNLATFALKLAK